MVLNRKTNPNSSIFVVATIFLCFCGGVVLLWGTPIGQKFRPILLQETTPTPPAINYAVATSSSQFEQLWVTSPVFNNHHTHHGGVHLDATGKHAFLLGGVQEDTVGELTLTKLDLLTGVVEWSLFYPPSLNAGAATTLDVNSDHIYVGFDGTQKIGGNITWGAGKVVAYDAETGDVIWSKIVPGARGIETLVATDSTVSIDGSFSSNYYLLEAKTGDVTLVREKEGPNLVWFVDNGILYERQKSFSFVARDRITNEIIWQSEVGYPVLQPPILTDKAIVARSGDTSFLGIAFAVDNSTGDLIWEFKDALSNVAISNYTAFFLTKDIQLIAVDIETGKILGQVDFISNQERDRTADIHHFVAAGYNIVLVYLGDSQQLFAFRFSPSK